MKNSKTLNSNKLIIISIILFFLCSYLINDKLIKPNIVISKQDATWNINNKMLNSFNLGYKRLESSFLWIATILESDIDHYKSRDLNSWMFLRFNSIAELEPNFYENYKFGGVYLSIIKDDLNGASMIYDKGVRIFPENFTLQRDALYHYYFQSKEKEKAYKRIAIIKRKKDIDIGLIGLITRLQVDFGKSKTALENLYEYQKIYKTGTLIGDKIAEKIKQLEMTNDK